MSDLSSFILPIINHYGYAIVFFGTIFGGELVFLAAVFLAILGLLNIYLVIFFGLAGVLAADNFWYFVGKKINGRFVKITKIISSRYQKKIDFFKNKFDNNSAKFLIFSKFIYGSRTITLLLAGYQHLAYRKFFVCNLIGSLIWFLIIIVLGSAMGLSWEYLQKYGAYFQYLAFFGILAVIVLRYVFSKIIKLEKDAK